MLVWREILHRLPSDPVDRYKDTNYAMPPIKVVHLGVESGERFGHEYRTVDGYHLYQALQTLECTTAAVAIVGRELSDLNISRRTLGALVLPANYETVEQVRAASDDELLAIPHFGDKSLCEIRDALTQSETAYNPAHHRFIIYRMGQFHGLGISLRTEYALATSNYSTIEQVRRASDAEFLSIRAFGINSLQVHLLRCRE